MVRDKPTLFIYFMLLMFELCRACPTSCVCKWKYGKQTVECINKDLLIIPEGMDSGTQVLEFSGNNLQTLHKEKFLKMGLIHLQRIYLSRCAIKTIDDRTFKGLTNLVELDLSGNLLETIPTEAFMDCPSLMRLTLSSNPIKILRKASFNHLPFLTSLELSNCEIYRIEEGAFQGLLSLEWLHLDGNKLSTLKGKLVLPESLKGVELQNNRWECDCHILDLHARLLNFNIPHSVEPVCSGPARLSGQAIKSIPVTELACLPDVSPTTFYLEISEGKNISLLCQVHAIPEAHVSWWFQGQLLQNDTMIAPGVHLVYYIERGTVEKRSELFIYNANMDDNGTFICNAENPAGLTQANFTIRVIVHEVPTYEPEVLPFEYVIIVMSAAAVSVLLLIFIIILSIVKCQRNARLNKKRDNSKIAALNNTAKDNLLQEHLDEFPESVKDSSIVTLVDRQQMIRYSSHPNEELLRAMSPVSTANQVRSPTSLRRYQLEQNPDIINGTESIGRRREADGQHLENRNSYQEAMETGIVEANVLQQTILGPPDCDVYNFSPDMHLSPVGLFNVNENRAHFYRTLPYNRANKRQSAANPLTRFSREAEFLCRSTQPAPYEHYCHDVRYTADGYPVRPADNELAAVFVPPSPPESHKSDSITSTAGPCCSTAKVQWPSCVPANLRKTNYQDITISKKSVGAQTQTDQEDNTTTSTTTAEKVKPIHKSLCNIANAQETITENHDEGYEGESAETNSNAC